MEQQALSAAAGVTALLTSHEDGPRKVGPNTACSTFTWTGNRSREGSLSAVETQESMSTTFATWNVRTLMDTGAERPA